MKPLAAAFMLLASVAWGQGARIAVHPLELPELTPAQGEMVQAQFAVMLARQQDIRLAGSSAVEDAVRSPNVKGCEMRDDCMRAFARATDSLYAVYVRLRPDPLGSQLVVNSRVIRSDGAEMRKITLATPLDENDDRVEVARLLLAKLLADLDLQHLSRTLTLEPVAAGQPFSPAPLFAAQAVQASPRQPVGFSLLGVGGVALVAGVVVAALAVDGRSKLTVDANGAVPPNQAVRALVVAREAQVASVMIPVGAVIAVAGAGLAWWPL